MNIKNIKAYIEPIENLKADKKTFMQTGVPVVKDGNWDLYPKNIEESDVYVSIKALVDGEPFEDTPIYFKGKKILENGQAAWGYNSLKDFKENRGNDILTLYHSVKSVGVLPVTEVNPKANPRDNISVAIGRNGEMFVFDGMHRYCIAKLTGKTDIPIDVVVRHPLWVAKRDALRAKIGDSTYNPIDHPDFSDIPSTWTRWRYNMILRDMKKESIVTVLDLGSHFGYFASELAKEGYNCTAIELNRGYFDVMQTLKATVPFWFKTSREDVLAMPKLEADCILALNLFHHFLKTEDAFKKFTDMLGSIKSNVLYFQAHNPQEAQMDGAYKNFEPDEFCKFIVDNSQYSTYELVGTIKGRNIYKFK